MSISTEDIPELLKTDKFVVPYINRSIELAEVNPIVSYYCKIYVLDHILNNKLHTTGKDIELFTIKLLENTEAVKNTTDESIKNVLANKTLSVGVVFTFAYKVFNSAMESLATINQQNKFQIASKIKAGINFLSLLDIFKNDAIDWSQLTNGKTNTSEEFYKFNGQKIKILKFNLSKLLKNQLPQQESDQDLEAELNLELQQLENAAPENTDSLTETGNIPADKDEVDGLPALVDDIDINSRGNDELSLPSAPSHLKVPTNDESENATERTAENKDIPHYGNTNSLNVTGISGISPENIESNATNAPPHDIASINLPGAPHFAPEDDGGDVRLPGVPKFLPDDDLTSINKSSAIHIIPKSDVPAAPRKVSNPSFHEHGESHAPITKETINLIVDRNEGISKAQKHAKFAISALNYEDLETAERELTEGLKLIQLLKQQDER